ncbi:hypothetical protein FHG87_010268 [Trinorchestia longiramus]|nr:hypothetical protein FHG87_010268 [Trinorchestia longiramus]
MVIGYRNCPRNYNFFQRIPHSPRLPYIPSDLGEIPQVNGTGCSLRAAFTGKCKFRPYQFLGFCACWWRA